MEMSQEMLYGILDAYPYEVVLVSRDHIIMYVNRVAKLRYGDKVKVGNSLFNCHNENSRKKIEAFLARADAGENEMFTVVNGQTGEREFFDPVRDKEGKVVAYFERHEKPWTPETAGDPIGEYWIPRN